MIKTLLVSIVTVMSLALMQPMVASAMVGGFGGKPANPDASVPRTKDIFIYTLKGGDTKADEVLISNNTDIPQTIAFYPTDAAISNTGAFTCKQRVEARQDVGAWVSLSQNEVTLEPGTSTKVPFTVTAPQGVAPGEHDGCLAFEPKDDDGHVEGNVRIHTRSAVRIAVTVPGDLRRNVDITAFSASLSSAGRWNYKLSVKNTGNVSADTKTTVRLNSLFGSTIYHNEGVYPVIAGNKYEVTYTDTSSLFWGGIYRANASIDYDSNPSRFSSLSSPETIMTKYAPDQYVFVTPRPLALFMYSVLCIVALSVVGLIVYRRREKTDALQNWHTYTLKEHDTIQSIADKYQIGWKKLAKINDRKAPYVLTPGEKIRVPNKKKSK